MTQMQAIPSQFYWITPCNDVDQQPSLRHPVKCCCHSCCHSWRGNAWTNRDEELHLLGNSNERGSRNPSIFTRASSRKQCPRITETVHRVGKLLQVFRGDGTPSNRGT